MKLIVKPDICILAALSILLLPWKWILSLIFATAIHELFHYATLRLFGFRVAVLQIGFGGISMETDSLPPVAEVLCAAAGPVGSLLLTGLSSILPRVALCGFFHFLYNLVPIYPQDGARILRGIFMCILPSERVARIEKATENIVILLMMCMTVFACLRLSMGLLPVVVTAILILKIKIPCKQGRLRVQ